MFKSNELSAGLSFHSTDPASQLVIVNDQTETQIELYGRLEYKSQKNLEFIWFSLLVLQV